MLVVLALLGCRAPAAGDTDVAVTVVTWDDDLVVDADYTVPAGTKLVIEPGVTVDVDPGVKLVVDGELDARGTEDEPIFLKNHADDLWGGVVFADDAIDATFDGVDEYRDGSILEDVHVEGATRGLELDGASPYLHAVSFETNHIPSTVETIGGAALLVRDGATPRIRDCWFEANEADTFAFGGALYVHHADPIVQDCQFSNNTSTYGGALATDVMASPIVGSTFQGNTSRSDGGAISLVSTVSALMNDRIVDNVAADDGGGVHVCVDCDPHAAPSFYDDVVTGNATTADTPQGGAGGIGAAFVGGLAKVDLHDNTRAGSPSDFSWFNLTSEGWPSWVASPFLHDVWWGTTDAGAVDAAVFDGDDDPTYASVRYDVAAAPLDGPLPRAVLATRRPRYQDAGDEIPVFLTVYNPGAERTATLTLTVDEGDGPVPFDGELAYPDATKAGDGWTLDLPENSVWFGTIATSTYDGAAQGEVAWTATLADQDGTIGVPVVARYDLSPVSGP